MTAWTSVMGPFAVVVAVLLVPGLLLGLVLRLRGLLLVGSAAPLSVAVVAGSAVVAGAAEVPWSWVVPLTATAAAAAVLAIVDGAARALLRPTSGARASGARRAAPAPARRAPVSVSVSAPLRRDRELLRSGPLPVSSRTSTPCPEPVGPQGPRVLAALVGAVGGCGLVVVGLRRAIVSPDLVSQSADELFHLNAVRFVLRTGDASSLHLSRLTAPEATTAFYPGAWHGVVALVVQLTGVSIPVATNLLAMACAAVLWPLAVVVLADRVLADGVLADGALADGVLPRRPAGVGALVAAGVLSGVAPGFPWLGLSWGVLYPTVLAVALLPAVAALVVACVQQLRTSASGPATLPGVLLAVVVCVGGLGLAHPSAVAGLVVLVGPLLAGAAVRLAVVGWRAPGSRRTTAAAAAAVVAVALAAVLAARRVDLLTSVMQYRWPDDQTLPQAVGQALLLAPASTSPAALVLAVLALVGAVVCLRRGGAAWLAVAWVVAAVLYVVAETTPANVLTGAWYNDSNRLAILLVVPAVLVAAVGAGWLGEVLAERAQGTASPSAVTVLAGGAPVGLALLAALGPVNGMTVARGAVRDAYPVVAAQGQIISADELALYQRVAAQVPADAVIANDPFQGTSIVMAMADRTPLFPHIAGRWDADDLLLGSSLDRVGTDPAVCAAARAKGVQYLLETGYRSYDGLPRAPLFTGIVAAAASGAFTLVDQVGEAKLYRLDVCAQP